MQNADSESKDLIPKIYEVKIQLEPITLSIWYEMKREQILPSLSDTNQKFCAFCLEQFESTSTYAKCLNCSHAEVLICLECLRMGAESQPHKRSHRYVFHDSIGPTFFDDEHNAWGAQEDLQLLNSFIRAHLDQWPELSKDFGRKKSLMEALDRFDRCFLRNGIGQCVLSDMHRGKVLTWDTSNFMEEEDFLLVAPDKSALNCNNGNDLYDEVLKSEVCPVENVSSDSVVSRGERHHPSSLMRRHNAVFDEEDESDVDDLTSTTQCSNITEIAARDLSSSHFNGESSTSLESRRATRKEQLLAAAKNVAAAEAFLGQRKTSLELSEAINMETPLNGIKNVLSDETFSDDKLSDLYSAASRSPFFYSSEVPLTNSRNVAKFDEEDLQLLTYLPFRDEFDHEYKNDAEQLISRIFFPREGCDLTEVDKFFNEVIYVRFKRYNRLMRIRATKRAIIREHDLLNEYLNIVKSNISEKGKYAVFEGRCFNTKNKEDFFRPVFSQLRQVAEKETIKLLAHNVGEMETLRDQINELKQLQRKGDTKLKGRLKVDSAPIQWSKKRKAKRSENVEQRKAGLRWKRIKRWTKKNKEKVDKEVENY